MDFDVPIMNAYICLFMVVSLHKIPKKLGFTPAFSVNKA